MVTAIPLMSYLVYPCAYLCNPQFRPTFLWFIKVKKDQISVKYKNQDHFIISIIEKNLRLRVTQSQLNRTELVFDLPNAA